MKLASTELRLHQGRPLFFCEDGPVSSALYSPVSAKRWELFTQQVSRFIESGCRHFFLTAPTLTETDGDFAASPFWHGDDISSTPSSRSTASFDEMASYILERQPQARWFIRFNPSEPRSWIDLHPQDAFLSETGTRLPCASLASERYQDALAAYGRAVVEHCNQHPWAERILGYWYGPEQEGTPLSINHHWLYDHSEVMQQAWRAFLHRRYSSDEALAAAWNQPGVTRRSATIPKDPLRRSLPEVASIPFWQDAIENQPLRDYLLLLSELFHQRVNVSTAAMRETMEPGQVLLYDMLKLPMQGWSISSFFDPACSWPIHPPETMAGSGHRHLASILDHPGIDGLVTPHCYQRRGPGGVFEPEGLADSAVLRGKLFFVEMDTRSWNGVDAHCVAETPHEWAALSWRNLASAWTRGLQSYWMDVFEDWFSPEPIQATIHQQIHAARMATEIPHETVPGVAVILDDTAVSETNGSGAFHHEAVIWELRGGLAQCGVPYRIYTFEDLQLDAFPKHTVYYFPNLFRVTPERLALLEKRVLRDGNVVVWGPGSGISDGLTISPLHAQKLTGFEFDWDERNYPRRVTVVDYDHPATRHISRGSLISSALAYGPCLFPRTGCRLGDALAKKGKRLGGLAAQTWGHGPGRSLRKGAGDYGAVFTSALGLPPQFWQGVTEWAGGHVYHRQGGVIMASRHLVGLHWQGGGKMTITLPEPATVDDLINGRTLGHGMRNISFEASTTGTRLFRLSNLGVKT